MVGGLRMVGGLKVKFHGCWTIKQTNIGEHELLHHYKFCHVSQ